MNSKYFFIILLIVAGAVIFGSSAKQKLAYSNIRSSSQSNSSTLASLQPLSKTMGVVEVTLTPKAIATEKELIFDLAMNNHSIDLNYDYTKIVTLLDDQGNKYKPSKWTGNTGGHHIRGKLIFAPLSETPKELTLTLDGVDNKTETFHWQLQKGGE